MAMEAIIGIILFLAIGAFIYGPWQWICTDVARQIVLERRDAIFDMARAVKLSFRSDEYREIRRSLEGTIRFALALTLPRFLYTVVSNRLYKGSDPSDLSRAVARIENAETRKDVQAHEIGRAHV